MLTATAALDYYLLGSAGLLVEEFDLADDLSAIRLRSAGWTPADGWWSSAGLTRAVRTDPRHRAQVTAADRGSAEEAYRRLSGAALPDEQTLRGHFHDDIPLASGAPLRLGDGPEVHRVLFAGEPDAPARLHARLLLADAARPGVVGTGRLTIDGADLRWDLRRIGGSGAWCIDVTSAPAGRDAVRELLRRLTFVARCHRLIPATIDRLG